MTTDDFSLNSIPPAPSVLMPAPGFNGRAAYDRTGRTDAPFDLKALMRFNPCFRNSPELLQRMLKEAGRKPDAKGGP